MKPEPSKERSGERQLQTEGIKKTVCLQGIILGVFLGQKETQCGQSTVNERVRGV